MYVLEDENAPKGTKVLYPTENGSKFNTEKVPSLSVHEGVDNVSIGVRMLSGTNKWNYILFAGLTEDDLQKLIDELQLTCDSLKHKNEQRNKV